MILGMNGWKILNLFRLHLFALVMVFSSQNVFALVDSECVSGKLNWFNIFGGFIPEDCPAGCVCPGHHLIARNTGEYDFCNRKNNNISSDGGRQNCSLITSGTYKGFYGCSVSGTDNACKDMFYRCPDTYPNGPSGSADACNCYLNLPVGKYVPVKKGGMQDCPKGYYCPVGGQIAYTDCPAGKQIRDNMGTILTTDANFSEWVKACPVGTYSTQTGLTSASACSSCPARTTNYNYVANGTPDAVTKCKEQRNAGSVGLGNCESGALTKTATNTTSWGAATSTLVAKAGYKISGTGDSTTCVACGTGYYSASAHSGTSCTSCGTLSGWTVSTAQTNSTSLTQCYAEQTPANCKSGKVRKYKTTSGWGDVSVVSGQSLVANKDYVVSGTQCLPCPGAPDGWTLMNSGTDGGTSWSYCHIKKTIEHCNGYAVRRASNSTTYGADIDTSSVNPDAGYYKTGTGADTKCELCGVGTISDGGAGATCKQCPGDKPATNPEHTQCLACNEKDEYIDDDGLCQKCPAKPSGAGSLYSFIKTGDTKDISSCALKLTSGNCSFDASPTTTVIYTYDVDTKQYKRSVKNVIPKSNSVLVKNEPTETEFKDYCEACPANKYNVGNECVTCGTGNCISETEACIACPAGKKCAAASLRCDNAPDCPKNTYSVTGLSECVQCASGYSTQYSGATAQGFDGLCTKRSNGFGVGCISAEACKAIPAQLCFDAKCQCKNNSQTTSSATIESLRDVCGSSFPLSENMSRGTINRAVISEKSKPK